MEDNELLTFLRAQSQQIAAQGEQLKELTALIRGSVPTQSVVSALNPITVRQLFTHYSAAKEKSHSWKVAKRRLSPFVAVYGDTPIMQISMPLWAAFRQRRTVDDPIAGNAVGATTINMELAFAKAMFSWASGPEQALIPSNPLTHAKKMVTASERETWLTEDDIAVLLRFCNPLLRAWVLVAVDTGLRINEILKIRRDKVRLVEIENGDKVGIVEFSKRQTKGRKPHRVALTPRSLAAIQELPATVNPYVFASPQRAGEAISARHVQRLFRDACVAAGLDVRAADGDKAIRPHDLRHSAASAATRRGASLLQVQRMLNHASPLTTQRYVHQNEIDVVAMAKLMEGGAAKERRPPRAAPSAQAASPTKTTEGVK